FRKERDIYFRMRFQAPTASKPGWSLKGPDIFKAKKEYKSFVVDGKRVICRVGLNSAITIEGITPNKIITINEIDIPRYLLTTSVSMSAKVIKQICKDHATSSSSSILISGCIENNFAAGKAYPGYKLRVDLKSRVPFSNPFVSG
ncbi:MAG: hypothetical protein ACREUE_11020, partial [Panacagrimonas sp.]